MRFAFTLKSLCQALPGKTRSGKRNQSLKPRLCLAPIGSDSNLLKKLNCMTFCEIVMALSLADYYEDFFNILQNIRYRQGIIGMATRNHYTMADWLPANAWCLNDISRRVGSEDTEQVTRTISHKNFFAGKGITDIPIMLRQSD